MALLAVAAVALLVAGLRDRPGRADGADGERDSQAAHGAAESARPQLPAIRGAQRVAADDDAAVAPAAPTPILPDHVRPSAANLDAELSLLRRARAALTGGTHAEALALLAEHEQRFPTGHLAEERMVLRVQALRAIGRRDEARVAAARFAAQHPGSPHTPTMAAMCLDDP